MRRVRINTVVVVECVYVALVIQNAMRMRHIVFPAAPYFSTVSHKRHDFRVHFEHKICV